MTRITRDDMGRQAMAWDDLGGLGMTRDDYSSLGSNYGKLRMCGDD